MNTKLHDYTATPADIAQMAKAYFASQDTVSEGLSTYLRALVATAQVHVRLNKSEPLSAIQQVHDQFYAEVIAAAQEATPQRTPGRAVIVNRRTNFARTSFSTLRGWIRNGGDLLKLVPKRVTKGSVTAPRKEQAPSPRRLRKVLGRRVLDMIEALNALEVADRDSARSELDSIVERLADMKPAAPRRPPKRVELPASH